MPKEANKMQSWQVFHYARKHLSSSKLYVIFGKKNARAVDYWCEDPDYTARLPEAYDPIRGVKRLLESLDDHGHCAVVKSTLAYLASGTSSCCDTDPQIEQLKPTMAEEMLADYSAVASLQKAFEEGHNAASIKQLKAAAIAEIERTVAHYMKDQP
ncbi:MAG: hypothetical protein ACOYB1_18520 [Limnohabitans sp.]